jgi:molybdate transport system regulatory protein
MPKPRQPFPSLIIRIDLTPDAWIGHGKIELLEAIARHGSISAAGRAMNMSYKRAWDLVEEINGIFGQDAVARQVGGKHGGGAALTDFGVDLIKRYRRIEHAAASIARKDLVALGSNLARLKRTSSS